MVRHGDRKLLAGYKFLQVDRCFVSLLKKVTFDMFFHGWIWDMRVESDSFFPLPLTSTVWHLP